MVPLSARDLLLGAALPAAVGAAVSVAATRGLGRAGQRHAAPAAVALGVSAGWLSLKLGPLQPTAHWHWLPLALAAAWLAGAAAWAEGVHWLERLAVMLLVTAAASALLAPDWAEVSPPRRTQAAVWSAAVAALSLLLAPVSRRVDALTLALALTFSATAGAAVLALSGSLRLAQCLGTGCGALAGLTLAVRLSRQQPRLESLAWPFMILVGGAMWVGQTNSFSDVPLASYAAVPAAPLLLWLTVAGPPARLSPARRRLVQLALVLLACGAAVGLAIGA